MLNEEGVEVAPVTAGYISKVIFDKSKCKVCKTLLTTVKSDSSKFIYLNKLSGGGLVIPFIDLLHYVSKSFAILDCISDIIKKSSLPERKVAEYVLSERLCATLLQNELLQSYFSRILSRFLEHPFYTTSLNGCFHITPHYYAHSDKFLLKFPI